MRPEAPPPHRGEPTSTADVPPSNGEWGSDTVAAVSRHVSGRPRGSANRAGRASRVAAGAAGAEMGEKGGEHRQHASGATGQGRRNRGKGGFNEWCRAEQGGKNLESGQPPSMELEVEEYGALSAPSVEVWAQLAFPTSPSGGRHAITAGCRFCRAMRTGSWQPSLARSDRRLRCAVDGRLSQSARPRTHRRGCEAYPNWLRFHDDRHLHPLVLQQDEAVGS